jgi:hypothetical protein
MQLFNTGKYVGIQKKAIHFDGLIITDAEYNKVVFYKTKAAFHQKALS